MEVPQFGSTDSGQEPVVSAEPQEQAPEDSLASPFLSKIPAQDRAVVGRYIKDWDAGVTKKFQELRGALKPYEQLGPAEELQRHIAVSRNLRQNPEGVFKILWNAFQEQYPDDFEQNLARILELEEAMSNEQQQFEPFQGNGEQQYEPDPNEAFQQNVLTELQELRQFKDQYEQTQQQQEESAQLDNFMKAAHTRYGDFDDDWVLLRLSRHGNIEQAMKEWQQFVGKHSSGPQRQVPKIPGGQGGVPANKVEDVNKLRGKDRRDAVAARVQQLMEG